ncbi:MAG: GIY-YIG nuclease family protein [Candidatus Omnitrophica bacterium]|nr:GIY-YIG nuclease family protein [Candidatus Omnitrophota bacterium]
MQAREKKSKRLRCEKWFLYMLKCADFTLYTGIAKDLEKRFKRHAQGKGARYTRTRLPLEIVYREICKSRTQALVRECTLKALPRTEKLALIEGFQRKQKNREKFSKQP